MIGSTSQSVKFAGKVLLTFLLFVPLIFSWAYLGDSLPILQNSFIVLSVFVVLATYDLVLLLVVDGCKKSQIPIPESTTKFINRFGLAIPVVCHVAFLLMFVFGFWDSIFVDSPMHTALSVALLVMAVLYPICAIIGLGKSQPFFAALSILAFGPCAAIAMATDSFLISGLFVFGMLSLWSYSISRINKENLVSPELISSAALMLLVTLAVMLVPVFIDLVNAAMPLLGSDVQIQVPSLLNGNK